jgi:glycosyltransferase involved in cell wall biosynthesis
VLHLDTGREMRGGQWQVLYLVRGLSERGIENRLLTGERSALKEHARLLPVETGDHSAWRLREWSRWSDVVHVHDARAHTHAALWSRAPVVVSRRVAFPIHGGMSSWWKYRRAALYLAVSRAVAQVLESAGVPSERIRIVHDAAPVPPEAGLRDGGVLALDSADPLKGKAAIQASGLQVQFTSNLLEALQHARLFVYITESEGLGSAALAALAHGVPVVASRVGGLPEVVRHEVTGLLVDRNEPRLIRETVERLLAEEPMAALMGLAGRRMVIEEFSVAKMVDGTMAAYSEVTGN